MFWLLKPALDHSRQVLIFDEGDQLLDMGFQPAILKIMKWLPRKEQFQTLVFSATMPEDLRAIIRVAFSEDYRYVDCVGEEQATHHHVPQQSLVVSRTDQFTALASVIEEARADPNHKIIVFFTTARLTQFYSELFNLYGIEARPLSSLN
jgi:ATP-dependent RNA helicase MSS116